MLSQNAKKGISDVEESFFIEKPTNDWFCLRYHVKIIRFLDRLAGRKQVTLFLFLGVVMQDIAVLNLSRRADIGKGASRRLRRAERVPAIIYGHHIEPVAVEIEHRFVVNFIRRKDLSSHIFDLNVDGAAYKAIIKNLERHVYKNKVTHIEFQAVSAKEALTVDVPLVFLNADRCVGIKKGAVLSLNLKSVKVRCLPQVLPSSITIDLADLDVGQSIHLSHIQWPAGVESYELMLGKDHDLSVVALSEAE